MADFNKVILVGRLTRDPELRYTQGGTPVAEAGIAVNRRFTRQDGSKVEEVMFIDLVAWARRGEVMAEYLHKGSLVMVEGHLDLDQWQASDGSKRSRHRVIVDNFQFLDRKGDDGQRRQEESAGAPPARSPSRETAPPASEATPPDDDFPIDTSVPF